MRGGQSGTPAPLVGRVASIKCNTVSTGASAQGLSGGVEAMWIGLLSVRLADAGGSSLAPRAGQNLYRVAEAGGPTLACRARRPAGAPARHRSPGAGRAPAKRRAPRHAHGTMRHSPRAVGGPAWATNRPRAAERARPATGSRVAERACMSQIRA